MVEHVLHLNQLGYGYTRLQLQRLAADLADSLNKPRKNTAPTLSKCWLQGFLKRWPELRTAKPRSLEMQRARCCNQRNIDNYFKELEKVIMENGLKDKPERIYNLDETGVSTEHKPPKVVCGRATQPQSITSPRGANTTILSCGNAIGNSIPPYFIFKGARWEPTLLEGSLPGSAGTVSPSGWSNGDIFKSYLKEHFLKFIAVSSDPILLLYDGHTSHISQDIVEWARKHHIILFVLPPHTSHILQPLDVGVFGPLKIMYSAQCQTFMRENPGEIISRWNVCQIISKIYHKAFSPNNLIASFRKTGICPFDPTVISKDKLAPSTAVTPTNDDEAGTPIIPVGSRVEKTSPVDKFLASKLRTVTPKRPKKARKPSIRGNLMTQFDTSNNDSHSAPMIKQTRLRNATRCPLAEMNNENIPQPGPSKPTSSEPKPNSLTTLSESDTENDEEKCIVCQKWTPYEVRGATSIIFVKWAQCDQCKAWCHLKYCTKIKVVRCNGTFLCPFCDPTTVI